MEINRQTDESRSKNKDKCKDRQRDKEKKIHFPRTAERLRLQKSKETDVNTGREGGEIRNNNTKTS